MPKASTGKKKTSTTKKRTNAVSKKQQALKKSQQKAYIAGMCLILFSIIFGVFIYAPSSGIVGTVMHSFLFGVWGLGAVFLPILLLILGIYSLYKKNPKDLIAKSIFLAFSLLFLSGLLAQFSVQIVVPSTPIECYQSGQMGAGGGLLGGSLYLLLSRMTGNAVCAIILIVLFILSLTLTTRFSFLRFLSGMWQGLRENKEVMEVDYEKSYQTGKKVATKSAQMAQKARQLSHRTSVDIPLTDEEEAQMKMAPFAEDEDALKAQKTFAKVKKADQSLKETIDHFPVYGLQPFSNDSAEETAKPLTDDSEEKAPYSGTFIPSEDPYSTMPSEEKEELPFQNVSKETSAIFKSDDQLRQIADEANQRIDRSNEPWADADRETNDIVQDHLPDEEETITFDLSQDEIELTDFQSAQSPDPHVIPRSTADKLNFPPAPGISNIPAKEHDENQIILNETIEATENHLPQKPIILPYTYPSISLLAPPKADQTASYEAEIRDNVQKLVRTLESFNVKVKPLQASRGPSVTRYELQPGLGVKVSKITGLADDIALNLAATSVRIEAPIPGKAAIGIEVPNKNVSIVALREVIESDDFQKSKSKLSVALGKDIAGNPVIGDIGKMPHVLIAGATGSGKSVCINTLITSLIYKANPNEVKFIMIDPKVVELGIYNGIPHLLVPVVTDPAKAAGSLNWAVQEMTRRYNLFAENNVRDMKGYNAFITDKFGEEYRMPNIVIIIDELADLMMVAPNDVEDSICRLAQMARAAGMHLVIATQRPSVDVITGIIKANIPSRIAFAVSSQVDSRTILDMVGAEKLLGKGDMLYYPSGASKPKRLQGAFVSDKEIETMVDFIKGSSEANYDEDIVDSMENVVLNAKKSSKPDASDDGDDADELLPQAIEIAVDLGQISTSFIQRRLKVGYARAGRIIDQMEERGIISGFEGSKPRNVLINKEQWAQMNQ